MMLKLHTFWGSCLGGDPLLLASRGWIFLQLSRALFRCSCWSCWRIIFQLFLKIWGCDGAFRRLASRSLLYGSALAPWTFRTLQGASLSRVIAWALHCVHKLIIQAHHVSRLAWTYSLVVRKLLILTIAPFSLFLLLLQWFRKLFRLLNGRNATSPYGSSRWQIQWLAPQLGGVLGAGGDWCVSEVKRGWLLHGAEDDIIL